MDAKERVEICGLAIIGNRDKRAIGSGGAIAASAQIVGLNTRKVCLEGHTRVIEAQTGHRAGELDAGWMQGSVAVRPDWMIGIAIKTGDTTGFKTTRYLDQGRRTGREASHVVRV